MAKNEKELWRERWLGCINELTSFELQKKSWLDATQKNPHWSFVEFMCSYFDDLNIDDNYAYRLNTGWITIEEYSVIKIWHERLYKYDSPNGDDHDCKTILNDSKWLDILKLGIDAKIELAKTLNEIEKQILLEEINYLKYT